MRVRTTAMSALLMLSAATASAQFPPSQPGASNWRSATDNAAGPGNSPFAQPAPQQATQPGRQAAAPPQQQPPQPTRARVTKGSGQLPNEHGQVWRDYDITPYTLRVQNASQPEQAIVDWILRETGYEAWHSKPLGLLSADTKTLRVYHTPQMQSIVADIVDRFVNSRAESHSFGLRIVTVDNPNWRARALPLMTPIPVQSPGVQGWILAKEDAALMMAEMRRRGDYREHNPPHQMVLNGESLVVSSMRNRSYTKGVIRTQAAWPGYQPELGQLEEGFSLEFSPLMSLDSRTTDGVVKVRLAQVEKMLPVKLEVASTVAPNQRTEVQVPQMTQVQVHERFRWPTDQVLLLSMGVVATPGPAKPNMLTDVVPMLNTAPRADALLFVESKGPVAPPTAGGVSPAVTASRPEQTYHGRY
ncbi:MAG: hypothetical protein AAGA92_04115 [Planctomycetota bacterium]